MRSRRCERPGRFEFTATGGPVPIAEGEVHRHEFVLTPDGAGMWVDVIREDPISGRLVALVAPILTRFAMGHRVRTIDRLRERLAALASVSPEI